MSDNPGLTGATLAITQTVALWTVLMPPVHEVRHASPGTELGNDVRHAEMVIGGVSVAVGFIASRIEKSWTPLIASVLMTMTLVIAYEYTLRRPEYGATHRNLYPINHDKEA